MRRDLAAWAALSVFALMALLYAVERPAYFAVLDAIHVHPFGRPFLDARFVTAVVECWSRGVDVYARNPCDPLGRTLDYSPLWLSFGVLGGAGWPWGFGLLIDGAFMLALFAMRWRVSGRWEAACALGAALSWATLFGAERANTDLLMFALAVLVARLGEGRAAAARWAGFLVVLAAGLLKFYPLAMLALAVREPARRAWALGGVCAAVLALFVARFGDGLRRIGGNMADGLFTDLFGARSLPFGIGLVLRGAPLRDAAGLSLGVGALGPDGRALGWGLLAALTVGCALGAWRFGRGRAVAEGLACLGERERSLLRVGSVLCVGCFFGHQNIGYRAVFLLLVLPGLMALGREAGPVGRVARLTCATAVLVLWDGIVSRSRPGWLAMQLGWWWIVAVLMTAAVGLLLGEAGVRQGRAAVAAG